MLKILQERYPDAEVEYRDRDMVAHRYFITFKDGYRISYLVFGLSLYGNRNHEIAFLDSEGELDYGTKYTNDVIRSRKEHILNILDKVSKGEDLYEME